MSEAKASVYPAFVAGNYDKARLCPLPGPHSGLVANDFAETPRGAVWLYDLAPGVLYTQGAGHWELPVAERFKTFGDRHFARKQTMIHLHDWADVTGYDSAVRPYLTQWVVEHRQYVKEVHMLVRSSLVAMGVAAANVVTSAQGVSMQSYRDRAAFEKVVAGIVEKARRGKA